MVAAGLCPIPTQPVAPRRTQAGIVAVDQLRAEMRWSAAGCVGAGGIATSVEILILRRRGRCTLTPAGFTEKRVQTKRSRRIWA